MTTLGTLVEHAKRELEQAHRGQLNRLDGAITSTVETLTLEWTPDVAPGDIVSIDLEEMYVTAVSGLTLDVVRGYGGSRQAAHNDDALVDVRPRRTRWQIFQAAIQEVQSWPRNVYTVETFKQAVAANCTDLTVPQLADDAWLLAVQYQPTTTRSDEYPIGFRFSRAEEPDKPGGYALRLYQPLPFAGQIRVISAVPYASFIEDQPELVTDLEADWKIDAAMLDVLRYGVLARLIPGDELVRTDLSSQGLTRRADEVPPNHLITAAQFYQRLRNQRLGDEARRLFGRYGHGLQPTGAGLAWI